MALLMNFSSENALTVIYDLNVELNMKLVCARDERENPTRDLTFGLMIFNDDQNY